MLRFFDIVVGLAFALAMAGFPEGALAKDFQVLHTFAGGSDGAQPRGTLVTDQLGNLYGTTELGGALNRGTVFKIAPDGTETVLHAFDGEDGAYPLGGVILDAAGNLFGTTSAYNCCGWGTVFKLAPDGTLTTLYTFRGGADGAYPFGGLVAGKAGNLYGTTYSGGLNINNCSSPTGCGTVFKLAPDGTETVLHAFCPEQKCKDGLYPYAGLIVDKKGNLYGTTLQGGKAACTLEYEGCGTVFKITPAGHEKVLYSFGDDGGLPTDSLVLDKVGNLFGTTSTSRCCDWGTVFKLAPDGTLITLHTFQGGSDGAAPLAGPIMDRAGNIYGTTAGGGYNNCSSGIGCGTVFKIAPDGTETVLHTFCATKRCADGAVPYAGLVADDAGNLYGATSEGGAKKGAGTVFKLRK
jgi:uncharacterized repeat protein (TIGR03803 family)